MSNKVKYSLFAVIMILLVIVPLTTIYTALFGDNMMQEVIAELFRLDFIGALEVIGFDI